MRIPQVSPKRIGRVMNVAAYRISKKTAPVSHLLAHTAEKTINRKVLPGVLLVAEAFMHPIQIQELQRMNIAKNIILSSGDSFTSHIASQLEKAAKTRHEICIKERPKFSTFSRQKFLLPARVPSEERCPGRYEAPLPPAGS